MGKSRLYFDNKKCNKWPTSCLKWPLEWPFIRLIFADIRYISTEFSMHYASGMECGCFSDALELLSSLEMLWEFIWNAFRMRFGCILDALGMRLE